MSSLLVKLAIAAALFYVLTPGVFVTLTTPVTSVPVTHAVLFAVVSVLVVKTLRKSLKL